MCVTGKVQDGKRNCKKGVKPWKTKFNYRYARYTTSWDELVEVVGVERRKQLRKTEMGLIKDSH